MSLPEVSELERKWANSECQNCPKADKNLWLIAAKPCVEKKRIVYLGSFCAVRCQIEKKSLRIKESSEGVV